MRCDASQPHRVLSKAPRCRLATDQPTIGATQWLRTCITSPYHPPSAKKDTTSKCSTVQCFKIIGDEGDFVLKAFNCFD